MSLAIARGEPAYSLAGNAPAAWAAGLLAGWSLIAAGLGAWARRPGSRFGPLVVAAGLAWFLAEWNNPGAGVALAFTAGLVLHAACPPLIGHAALVYPGGRLRSRLERVAVAIAYGGAVLALGILPALFFQPAGQGCGQCPDNLLGVVDDPQAVQALNRVGIRVGLAWTVLLVALMGWRLLRSTAATRRLIAPVAVPAIAYLTLVAWSFQHALARGFLSNDALDRRLWLGQAAALVALALGVAWEWVAGPAHPLGARPAGCRAGGLAAGRAGSERPSPRRSATPPSPCCTRFPTGGGSTPRGRPAGARPEARGDPAGARRAAGGPARPPARPA